MSEGKQFDIHEDTIRTIKYNETAVRNSMCSRAKVSVNLLSCTRLILKEMMRKVLVIRIEDKSRKSVPEEGNTLVVRN